MTRYLLPAALLMVLLTGKEAFAHHHVHRFAGNPAMRAAGANPNMGYGFGGFGNSGYGNVYGGVGYGAFPTAIPMVYPGVGYTSQIVPGFPGNIYTQSYFNSPAYGHWNGFGN
ncbi:MAG TPA: hypothetical protein VHC22_27760 [Pirellulales bacterium]|nr:hypothetical protein [Pirellulales bacterium]